MLTYEPAPDRPPPADAWLSLGVAIGGLLVALLIAGLFGLFALGMLREFLYGPASRSRGLFVGAIAFTTIAGGALYAAWIAILTIAGHGRR